MPQDSTKQTTVLVPAAPANPSSNPKDEHAIATLYEQRLDQNLTWALNEGSRHFDEDNLVFDTLRRITHRLGELEIPYAVMGDLAMFKHGYRRYTEYVELLTTLSGHYEIHEKLEGNGYYRTHPHSKHLRDAE